MGPFSGNPAAVCPLDAELDGIKEGMAASDGFLEAVGFGPFGAEAPPTDGRKAELEEQLLRYCKFDTEAMVEIVRALTAHHSLPP